jgi:hypothetical protein
MQKKLQVFVSSTYTDLIDERQAAVGAILKAGHIPAGMELFTANDQSQWETIKAWIDQSDVYMLILGGRYGSVEANSKLSYTELEYKYAVDKKKPLFAVVITEDGLERKVAALGTKAIEKTYGVELQRFRETVLSNISSFFNDEKDIKLAVHESLADFAANRDLKGWVSGDAVSDPKPLLDEIKKLTDENAVLRRTAADLERTHKSKTSSKLFDYDELLEQLRAINVDLPAKYHEAAKSKKLDLFSLLYNLKEYLITGVTNEIGMSEENKFMYFTVAPKLQIHGLVENEKVPGVAYRRTAISQKGLAFLAEFERHHLKSTHKKTQAVSEPTERSPEGLTADSTTVARGLLDGEVLVESNGSGKEPKSSEAGIRPAKPRRKDTDQ